MPEVEFKPKDPSLEFQLRFRLIHLIYITAMIASSLATFGINGLFPGIVIVSIWTAVFLSPNRKRVFVFVCALILACASLCCLTLPAVSSAREAARRTQCSNNLRQISLALHNYHDTYKVLPPAYIADASGKPMHSWRVLILPYIEEQTLYEQYRFDESWDGPNNRKLANQMPMVYACPSHPHKAPDVYTHYLAVNGKNAAWSRTRQRKLKDFEGGTANVILVTESAPCKVHWMEPADISPEEAVKLFTSADSQDASEHCYEDFFYEYYWGRNMLYADGSVRFFNNGIDASTWSALFNINNGKKVDHKDIRSSIPHGGKIKWGNWFRLAMFICLMLLPSGWVWRKPATSERKAEKKNDE